MHPGRVLSGGGVVMVLVVFVLSSWALKGLGLPLLMSEPQAHCVASGPPGQEGRSWGMGPPSESMAAPCRPVSSRGGGGGRVVS